MPEPKHLVIKSADLPIPLEVVGPNGEQEFYLLQPATKRFGAYLNKIAEPLQKMLFGKK
ncbi:hypothetical protein AOG2_23910 [Geobacter sp. AOG2]|nr:hypothetical protein AOG2_23910 [Geobacter sp. AOG2]